MELRAVVFDYGMVLTGQPDPEAYAEMLRLTALNREQFEGVYWTDRHAYDEGKLSGARFWQKLLADAGLPSTPDIVDELNRADARMWTTQNPVMLAWQLQLKQHGLRTAILSNMGDNVLERIEQEFAWIHGFDVLVWSFQHKMAKPDPVIYHLVLSQLGTRPQETLFIDDRLVNIEAAWALGMPALQFTTVEKLRSDLIAEGFSSALPLPG